MINPFSSDIKFRCVHAVNRLDGVEFNAEAAMRDLEGDLKLNYSLLVDNVPMQLFGAADAVGFLHDASNSKPSGIYNRDAQTSELPNQLFADMLGLNKDHVSLDQLSGDVIELEDLQTLKNWMLQEYNSNHEPLLNNDIVTTDLDISSLIGIVYCVPDREDVARDLQNLSFFGSETLIDETKIDAELKLRTEQTIHYTKELQMAVSKKFGVEVPLVIWNAKQGILKPAENVEMKISSKDEQQHKFFTRNSLSPQENPPENNKNNKFK